MAEIKLDNSSSDHSDAAEGITRRELLKTGGKVAAAAAVSSVFSPFFIQSARAATKTLSFWQFYAPNGISNLQSKWFVDCVAAWNATHDVKVELQYVPNNDYMNGTKLQTAFASGHGPDIFIISPGDFLRYYNGGVLTDLTPYMEEEAKKDLFPNVMETRMVDGKIYGLPMEVEPMAMYYSVKAFDEAGLSEKDLPKTWDQFMELAHKLTKGNRFGCLFETTPGYYQTFTWYPFMWQGGGDIATQDGKKSAFNSPGTVQALKFWQDSIKQNVASRNYPGRRRMGCGCESGIGLLRHAKRWHLGSRVRYERMPRIFSTVFFRCLCRPAVLQKAFWADGLLSQTQKVRILRKPRNSVSGRSVRCRRTPSSASSTGVRSPRATFRRANLPWIKAQLPAATAPVR